MANCNDFITQTTKVSYLLGESKENNEKNDRMKSIYVPECVSNCKQSSVAVQIVLAVQGIMFMQKIYSIPNFSSIYLKKKKKNSNRLPTEDPGIWHASK